MSKGQRIATLAAIATLLFGLAGLSYVTHKISHHGDGPRHTYSLAGEASLTDEQVIGFAKQTLQRDGRFSDALELETFGDGNTVSRTREDDVNYATVNWRYPGTNDRWYVQLRRTSGQVEAVSYPGK